MLNPPCIVRVVIKPTPAPSGGDRGKREPESQHVVFSCNRPGGLYSCISECCSNRNIYHHQELLLPILRFIHNN